MIKKLLFFILFMMGMALSSFAEQACERPVPDDLYDYKENYVPVEYAPEPFHMELVDIGILAGLVLIAGWFSLKQKPAKWLTITMAFGLVYFGFIRGGCICPVGATTNFMIGLRAPELVGKAVAAIFLIPLIAAFFFGRIFCSSGCPIGAVQHLLSSKKKKELSPLFNRSLRLLPFFLLLATGWAALRGGIFIACRLDVYKLLFFTGYGWIDQLAGWMQGALVEPRLLLVGDWISWGLLFLTLVMGFFVPRPFCRFICPYGVLLGAIASLGFRRRQIDSATCVNCNMCEKSCPVQAIETTNNTLQISNFHCIQCGRCEESCKKDCLK